MSSCLKLWGVVLLTLDRVLTRQHTRFVGRPCRNVPFRRLGDNGNELYDYSQPDELATGGGSSVEGYLVVPRERDFHAKGILGKLIYWVKVPRRNCGT